MAGFFVSHKSHEMRNMNFIHNEIWDMLALSIPPHISPRFFVIKFAFTESQLEPSPPFFFLNPPNFIEIKMYIFRMYQGFSGGSMVKNLPANVEDVGLIPGSGRSPREGNGNPLHYSCLENSMDRGAWWSTVHGVTKTGTRLSNWTHIQSVQTNDLNPVFLPGEFHGQRNLAGYKPMRSQRVRHDWATNTYNTHNIHTHIVKLLPRSG